MSCSSSLERKPEESCDAHHTLVESCDAHHTYSWPCSALLATALLGNTLRSVRMNSLIRQLQLDSLAPASRRGFSCATRPKQAAISSSLLPTSSSGGVWGHLGRG